MTDVQKPRQGIGRLASVQVGNGPLTSLRLFGLTKTRIACFAILSLLAAFFEGFGMAMLLPVLSFVEKGQDIALLAESSSSWRFLLDGFAKVGIAVSLWSLLAAAIGTMLLRVLVVYCRQIYIAWLGFETQHTTRSNLLDAYIAMNAGDYARHASGSVLNLLATESPRAAGSFAALFAMCANLAVSLGLLAVLFWLSVPLTMLAIACLGVAGVAVGFHVRHTPKLSHQATAANDRYSRMVVERLAAFRLIKLTATDARETKLAREASSQVRDINFSLSRIAASVDLVMEPMVLLCGGLILYVAVSVFGLGLAELGIFAVVLLRLLPLAKEIARSLQTYNACAGSLAAVIQGYSTAQKQGERTTGEKIFTTLNHEIRFEGVTFTFPNGTVPALADVSVSLPAGRVTALVGPSGAGKTTMADTVSRLFVPQAGRVTYDGIDGSAFDLVSLRTAMAFVSQNAMILDDTVAANLRFVRPDATDEQLWLALKLAQADGFVRAMEFGLETRLGEKGSRLSGGQKQRLSLARALLQETRILVLDEPTSALDSDTENLVQQALETLRKRDGMTIIVIAHRLATIRDADKIVVLKDGAVLEQGSHDDLVLSEDWYARIFGMQRDEFAA